jgi:hypothetical protein
MFDCRFRYSGLQPGGNVRRRSYLSRNRRPAPWEFGLLAPPRDSCDGNDHWRFESKMRITFRSTRYSVPHGKFHEAKSDTGSESIRGKETGRAVPLMISAHNPNEVHEVRNYFYHRPRCLHAGSSRWNLAGLENLPSDATCHARAIVASMNPAGQVLLFLTVPAVAVGALGSVWAGLIIAALELGFSALLRGRRQPR